MILTTKGFSLLELLIASIIASVVAVGFAMANVAAARMTREQNHTLYAEASAAAQQTAELYRNMIACGEGNPGEWFDVATCAPTSLPVGWNAAPLAAGGTESIMNEDPSAKRCYRVTSANCAGTPGDCLQVEVAVCWNNLATCPC